jgi:galactokinase
MNSNKKRGLTDSKYNERRDECDRALEIINKHKRAVLKVLTLGAAFFLCPAKRK